MQTIIAFQGVARTATVVCSQQCTTCRPPIGMEKLMAAASASISRAPARLIRCLSTERPGGVALRSVDLHHSFSWGPLLVAGLQARGVHQTRSAMIDPRLQIWPPQATATCSWTSRRYQTAVIALQHSNLHLRDMTNPANCTETPSTCTSLATSYSLIECSIHDTVKRGTPHL